MRRRRPGPGEEDDQPGIRRHLESGHGACPSTTASCTDPGAT
ncbi:MAG TPA: hypothetical protein VNW71_05135 [Thermoanaerobaculia bacterium]|nr:hypothetical protein [Thermoanaerobaculia bacterium]